MMQAKFQSPHSANKKTTVQDTSRRTINFVSAKKSVNASISAVEAENMKKQQPVFGSPASSTAPKTPLTKPSSHQPAVSTPGTAKKGEHGTVPPVNSEAGLFPKEVIPKYLRWNAINRVGPGFFNEGNTCFLNSTLQCLLYLAPFSQCLLHESPLALKNVAKANTDDRRERAVIELYNNLVKDVWQSTNGGRAIAPKGMISCIRRVGKQFKPFRQEDAHEYLRQLLDCMHEEVLKFNRLKTSDGKKAETTVISRVFGGYLCNTLTCTRCQYTSKTYNHFQDLSLEIRQGINSVNDAIQAFTKIENLTQGNEWKCDGCKNKVKATKQLTIQEPPNVLVLHLKRFSFGNMFGKISKHIEFTERLYVPYNNSGRNSKDGQTAPYELTGVVVHHGHSTHSGHYIAYVKAPNGQWHEMNDSSVSIASVKKVLQAQGYLLFYTRVPSANEVPVTPKKVETKADVATAAKTVNKPVESVEKSAPATPAVVASATPVLKSAISRPADQEKSMLDDISSDEDEQSANKDSDNEEDDDNDDEDDDDDESSDESGYHYRIKLPIRFTGQVNKFKRWKPKKLLTDIYILGRILRLKSMHAKGYRPVVKSQDVGQSSSSESSESKVHSESTSESCDNDSISDAESNSSNHDLKRSTNAPTNSSSSNNVSAKGSGGGVDVLNALLEQSRRGRNIGGEGVWESVSANDKDKINQLAVQQRRKDQDDKRKTKLSDWDMLLDQGRVKKVKTKHDDEGETSGEKFSPFQRVLDERNEQQKRFGGRVDMREEPTFKHNRKDKKFGQKGGNRNFSKNNNNKYQRK